MSASCDRFLGREFLFHFGKSVENVDETCSSTSTYVSREFVHHNNSNERSKKHCEFIPNSKNTLPKKTQKIAKGAE